MFKTHTGLVIDLTQEDEEYLVTITGDRTKELLRTRAKDEAKRVYDHWVEHYKQRAKDEA